MTRMTTVDWPAVIAAIRARGLLVREIAVKVGIAPQTLWNLSTGATREPCYSVGVRLLELEKQ